MLKQPKQAGATTILLAMFVMNIILLIVLAAATIIMYEVKMINEMTNSIPAFYSADAGAEKCLYQVRKETGEGCGDSSARQTSIVLDSGATASAEYNGGSEITSSGLFQKTKRSLEITW